MHRSTRPFLALLLPLILIARRMRRLDRGSIRCRLDRSGVRLGEPHDRLVRYGHRHGRRPDVVVRRRRAHRRRHDGGLHARERDRDHLLSGRGREPRIHRRHRRAVLPGHGRRGRRDLGLGRRRARPVRPRRRLLGADGRRRATTSSTPTATSRSPTPAAGAASSVRHRQLVPRGDAGRLVPPPGAPADRRPSSSTPRSNCRRSPRSAWLSTG